MYFGGALQHIYTQLHLLVVYMWPGLCLKLLYNREKSTVLYTNPITPRLDALGQTVITCQVSWLTEGKKLDKAMW